MNIEIIYQNIRSQGGRITKIRDALIKIMLEDDCLISSSKLLLCLKKSKLEPNRSTIYRELQFLSKNNIITKNIIAGNNYYEINLHHKNLVNISLGSCKKRKQKCVNNNCHHELNNKHHHHHHLVCLECNSIIKVEMENHLEKQEQKLAKKNKFNIVNHSLDFYGYCQKCQAQLKL
ncbi:hypothetical protein GW758_00365 [Candidatus Falkowbacteria bacterium]|nr:hypothetical protein [Candidatus Falkowbacteria bacterium]